MLSVSDSQNGNLVKTALIVEVVVSTYKAIKISGKKIDEHRYIVEQILGRKLDYDEIVHHKNGNKSDNQPENLEVISRSSHSKMHQTGSHMSNNTKEKLRKWNFNHLKNTDGLTRFNEQQIREIRQLKADGARVADIAVKFGVGQRYIYKILKKEIYSWVV